MTSEQEEALNQLASNIEELSAAVSKILNGRIKRETIIILLSHTTKMSQTNIRYVLNAIERMSEDHLNSE